MVKRLLLILMLLFPVTAWAADFTAKAEGSQVAAGEPFMLHLALSGTSAKGDPDISALEQSFSIVGQAQTSSYSFVNGNSSSSVGWQISLIPKQEGHLTIPPITIKTADGTLSTQPIELDVGKGSGPPRTASGDRHISVTAAADAKETYQDQPVRYAVKVIVRADLTDLSLDDFTVDNAIIDKPDQPKTRDEVENGVPVKVIEYDFVITPLKPGPLVIPPPVIHGSMIEPMQMPDPFNGGFEGMFKFMQSMGSKPFSLTGNEVSLDVKPPAVAMNPWLPLYSLQIKDEWSGLQDAKTGEPITRKITLLAEGVVGSQLPDLEADQNHDDFRVYADKASFGTNNGKSGEHVVGWRHESYTLIPQKSGRLILPAIRVPWWDIANNRMAYADLPEKTIEVAAGSAQSSTTPAATTAPQAQSAETSSPSSPAETKTVAAEASDYSRFLYAIIGILVAALLSIILWALRLRKKAMNLQGATEAKPPTANTSNPPPPSGLEELRNVSTPEELRHYLQAYAAGHWGASPNSPLEKILTVTPISARKELEIVVKNLTAALYAGRTVDMVSLKQQVENIRGQKFRKAKDSKNADKLQDLNPG